MGTPLAENDTGYKLGQRVRHASSAGNCVSTRRAAANASRLQVAFQGARDQMAGCRICEAGNGLTKLSYCRMTRLLLIRLRAG